MEVQQNKDKRRQRRVPSERSYCLLCILYLAILVALSTYFICFTKKYHIAAGLIIGSIYVVVALYYFYEQFLVPYLKEKKTQETPSERPAVYPPNILAWLVEWLFPALFLQLLLVFGFSISIGQFPFKGSIYSSPYEYGLVYKRFDAFVGDYFRQMERDNPSFNSEKTKKWEAFLKERFSGYLRKDEVEKKRAGAEKGLLAEAPVGKKASLEVDSFRDLEGKIYKIPFLIAFAFGFLGSLIYTLKDTAHRFYTLDMYPKTYMSYIIRFFFAPSLCLVVAYFMANDWLVNTAPILFFLIGFFPQTALLYIEDKARDMLKIRKQKKEGMPLDSIQGMTDYIAYRFKELGVDDVQNLANVNLTYLRRNMGYSTRLLADFIAQALLRLYFVDDFDRLRGAGIRSVLSFQANVKEENLQSVSDVVKIRLEKLRWFLDLLNSKGMKERIETLKQLEYEADKRERDQMLAELERR